MNFSKSRPRLMRVFLPTQHADHVEHAGLTFRLGSIATVRHQGDGVGSSLPSCTVTIDSNGGA